MTEQQHRTPLKENGQISAPASLQLRILPERIPWIYASLMNQQELPLYEDVFPDPFKGLDIRIRQNQEELAFTATFGIGDDFNLQHGATIGSKETLSPLLTRYKEYEFSPEGNQLIVVKDGDVHGIIVKNDNTITIHRGKPVGSIKLPKDGEINALSIYLDQFNLLVQRYVSAIWKASPETNQKKFQLLLDIPQLPDGALQTYFSTFEIVAKDFRARPRPLDMDDDIGGYPQVKSEIKGLFLDLTQPNESRKYGTQPFSNKFVLVTGDEGSGKSLFPKTLDAMFRKKFGDKFEHFRLPLSDMLTQYGRFTATIVNTILNHVKENEKKGIPTLLHLDNLEALVPASQRLTTVNLLRSPTIIQQRPSLSDAEFNYLLQTINPIVEAFRQLGRDLGGESHNVIVYGESRIPREDLPEGVSRTFRRSRSLDKPTVQDLQDILRIQINTSRKFAAATQHDPFISDILSSLNQIASHAIGLNGRDIQQALINIATRKKAQSNDSQTTSEEIIEELEAMSSEKGRPKSLNRRIGLSIPNDNR